MTTDSETQRTAIETWRAGLDDLHARIAPRFRRSEARERSKRYVTGLLLAALQQAEIAFPRRGSDVEYVFKHVSMREVAYNTLVQKRRQQLHLDTARAIASLYLDLGRFGRDPVAWG